MNDKNVQIGKNLERLRRNVSRDVLAAKMCDKGYRWSRATVFNIETGERALKLQEAIDVLDCLGLGVGYLPTLVQSKADDEALRKLDDLELSIERMKTAVIDLETCRGQIEEYLNEDVRKKRFYEEEEVPFEMPSAPVLKRLREAFDESRIYADFGEYVETHLL
ncbi:helix-turn-helix transcriptional regulator [Bifidobacterium callimiconis]|uniref:helix-turn-helix domain-containing protein n=1 Tax=Bifidobacterium callimiconis TaxID=2306973 RepID=UPI001BDD31B9|nr:helix-turn-helix transcriptional regulator [Bifidobacterium callimiconis]MBT1177598.1 helix-turn-helix transcriptional regulator [Bifidobacterium callimiconis]